MTTYRNIHGRSIQAVTTDPTETVAEGQVWYNTTSDTFKSVVVSSAWASSAPLITARSSTGSGTQTAGLVSGGNVGPSDTRTTLTEEYNGTGFSAGGAVTMEATYKSSKKNRPNFIAPIYPWMKIVDDQEPPAYGPPIFIVCTTEDAFKLAIPSAEIYADWAERNYVCELHLYHHGKHVFGMRKTNYPVDNWFDNMVDWIDAIGMLN